MDTSNLIQTILIYALPVLFAITVHEAAHGYAARHFGDNTAYMMGRITLNPAKHIDPVGTILMPLLLYFATSGAFLFGYAKPVPVNFGNLRKPKQQMVWVALAGPAWQTPAYKAGEGPAMLAASRAAGLEGVVAKRLDSVYEAGRRTGAWLKIKNLRRQELVIGGWAPGQGRRRDQVGALLVGYWDPTPAAAAARGASPRLVYAGKVGTGFSDRTLAALTDRLAPLRRPASPFAGRTPPAIFVEPVLVGEFEFSEWTPHDTLRHPSFKGLRADKDAAEVVREPTP